MGDAAPALLRARLALLLVLLLPPVALGAQSAADADALFEKAAGLFKAGSYEEVIPLLAEAAGIDEKLGTARRIDLAYDRMYLGMAYANTGKSDPAVEQLGKSAALFAALGKRKEQVEALTYLGLLDYYRAAYDAAERTFQSALDVARSAGLSAQVSATRNNLGLVLSARGRYAEALELYKAARDEHVKAGRAALAAESLGNIASAYLAMSRWSEAEDAYRAALASFEARGDAANAATTRINLGIVHVTRGSYDPARMELERGVEEAGRLGLRQAQAYGLGSLAAAYSALGLYDLAERTFLRALELDRALDLQLNVVSDSTGLGKVYQAWARYDRALELYRQSLEAAERYGMPDQELTARQLIGSVSMAQGEYDEAIAQLQGALVRAQGPGREAARMHILDALGSAYFGLRSFDRAASSYEAALGIARTLGLGGMVGRELINLGSVGEARGARDIAALRYREAVEACRSAGAAADEATALNNLGTLAMNGGAWPQAVDWFTRAIEIKERLRATATGENRMDFLASQISSYRLLVTARVRGGDPAGAVEASELSKARWLSEQLDPEGTRPGRAAFPGVASIQAGLGPRTVVLDYAGMDTPMPLLMGIGRSALRAWELSLPTGTSSPVIPAADGSTGAAGSRGFTIVRTSPPPSTFADAVAAYRDLLARAQPTPPERAERDRLSHALFDALLGPALASLDGIEELVVVPEGSLCALPLESLLMPDGRWLVERFHVTYVPSLTVRAQLAARPRGDAGRPLLAVGGAVYGGAAAVARSIVSDRQVASLRVQAGRLFAQERSVRELYEVLGLDAWADLPGTLAEATAAARLFPGSTLLTGAQATERRLDEMSRSGELRRYGVLHFATHGIAVPDAPELSALVLSVADTPGPDDGFLTAREIAGLRLEADFVNLSACNSGLGRILGGEGIVGLSQAFLSAGAAGLSVSLWPVSDEATELLMTGLYRLVREEGLSWARALTEMKRRFIRGGRWGEPLYWAPFVYYGVEQPR